MRDPEGSRQARNWCNIALMSDLVLRGFELAAFGMGTVFVFLTLLVYATMAMSALVARYEPVTVEPEQARSHSAPGDGPDAGTLAAISAAVRRYRETPRR